MKKEKIIFALIIVAAVGLVFFGSSLGTRSMPKQDNDEAQTNRDADIFEVAEEIDSSLLKDGFPVKHEELNAIAYKLANGEISPQEVKAEIMSWGQVVEDGIVWQAVDVYAVAELVHPGNQGEIGKQLINGFNTKAGAVYKVLNVQKRDGQVYAGKIIIYQ